MGVGRVDEKKMSAPCRLKGVEEVDTCVPLVIFFPG